MRDPEIRHALVSALRDQHPDPLDTRIWPEMTVGLGASRVDVGLVNGALSGFEIKSERDKLTRLPGQVENYGRCLDFAHVVVSGRYAESITDHVPNWWGVQIASEAADGSVHLAVSRAGRRNPDVDAFFVAQLLWRDEALDLLERHDVHTGLRHARRWEIWDRVAESLSLSVIRDAVRAALKARPILPGHASSE